MKAFYYARASKYLDSFAYLIFLSYFYKYFFLF